DRERDLGLAHERLRPDGRAHQVVAVKGDVERADSDRSVPDGVDVAGDSLRNRDAAATHANQGKVGQFTIALEDFVGDAGERTRNALGIHDYGHVLTSLRTLWSAFK